MPRGEELTVAGRRACLTSYKGYCLAVWEASGLIYTLISDVEVRKLAEIVATLSRA